MLFGGRGREDADICGMRWEMWGSKMAVWSLRYQTHKIEHALSTFGGGMAPGTFSVGSVAVFG